MCIFAKRNGGDRLKILFSLDRIENGIAVCYDGDQKKYEFPASLVPLECGSLFEAELTDGLPCNVRFLEEQTALVKKQNKKRLDTLFARKSTKK
jgi:hypothetical protein